MKLSNLLLWATPMALIAAEGDEPQTATRRACRGGIFTALHRNPNASSFCSIFLHSTATSTVTRQVYTTTVRTTQAHATSTITKTKTKTTTTVVKSTPYMTKTVTSMSNAAVSCASTDGVLPGSVAGGHDLDKRATIKTKAPYSTPSAFSGLSSSAVSSICSCIHVNPRARTIRTTSAQSTVTETKTVSGGRNTRTTRVRTTVTSTATRTSTLATETKTVTYIQPVPTTFNGLNWYAYPNNYDFTPGNPDINIPDFNSNNYEDKGTVSNPVMVAPGSQSQYSLPGSNKQVNGVQITVVMQGYLYASKAGTYTLTTGGSSASSVDNYVGLWTGQTAYKNYDNNNADWIAIRENYSQTQQGGSAKYQLEEGELLPVTLIYMNGGYVGNFIFNIITPDGTTHTDTSEFWILACQGAGLFWP